MKKLLFSLIASVLFIFNADAQSISELDTDKGFIEYVQNDFVFLKNFNSKKYNANERLNEDNIDYLFTVFNTNKEDFSKHINIQNNILQTLREKYKFVNYKDDELQRLLLIEIEEILTNNSNIAFSTQSDSAGKFAGTNCRRRYLNALAINASAATVGHIACLGGDLTVVIGLVCHGAVAIGQALANDNAYLDYLDCIR